MDALLYVFRHFQLCFMGYRIEVSQGFLPSTLACLSMSSVFKSIFFFLGSPVGEASGSGFCDLSKRYHHSKLLDPLALSLFTLFS